MKYIIKTSLLIAGLLLTVNVFAQKVGHINSAALLNSMPATKAAEKQLETYTKQLQSEYDGKVKAFESKYKKFIEAVQGGNTYTVKQAESKKAEFQKEWQGISQLEFDLQKKAVKKREGLLKPILDKVESAIKSVGGSSGYNYIFDTSMGAVLYAVDAEDVTPLVKSKLGLKATK